ncbi:MAG: transcription antitermination factor NusB [Calditrichaeota bacterium]|nr:transcription antitermination factor NusB [Calditrichota bacterium]MCB9391524.1 transcription antitermination factor NusB [Calditrichota bacterium]
MRSRRSAREWALRVLYAVRLTGYPVAQCFDDILKGARADQNLQFCRGLCERAASGDEKIDEAIRKAVQKWDMARLAVLDLLILRMAIAEFLYFDDIPYKVTINEAIELAKQYSTAQSGRFVNGILDAVCAEMRKTDTRKQKHAAVEPQ